MASVLRISHGAVGRWEAGYARPDIGRLDEIATVLNVSVDWLLGRTDDLKGQVISGVGGIPSAKAFGKPKVIQACASQLSDAELAREVAERLKRKKRPTRDHLAIGNAKVVQTSKSHKLTVVQSVADHQKGSVATPDAVETEIRFTRTDHFCLRIYGKSMEPRVRKGDIVVVRRMDLHLPTYLDKERSPVPPSPWKALHSKIIVAFVNESDIYLVKRLRITNRKNRGFKLWLVGDNPRLDAVEITKEHSLRIVGRVVQIISDPDRE